MKKRISVSIILLTIVPTLAAANPFRTRFVCVPSVAPDQMTLEFKVRDSGQCVEGELYLEVLPQTDGSILLMPVQDKLTPEEARDLENYRHYFGGEGGAAK